jgi:hypothetical protein
MIEQSAAQQTILDSKDYLVVDDKAAEAAYKFSMRETLGNGKEARRNGGVLAGFSVYICKGVANNNAPPLKALQLIVEAAGGHVMKSINNSDDPTKVIVLTSDPSTNAQLAEKGVDRIASSGAKILTTSWLFHTMITQQFSSHAGGSNSPNEKPKSRSKRKAEMATSPTPHKRKTSRRSS